MKNNGIFLRATQCKTVKQTDILHCAINHAETLPLKVKEPNEVNEDLTILLTTTMNCKRNQNLVIHIAVLRDESHIFQVVAQLSPRFHCTEENKKTCALCRANLLVPVLAPWITTYKKEIKREKEREREAINSGVSSEAITKFSFERE